MIKSGNLLLIGYSPARVARPYQVLAVGLNLAVLGLGMLTVMLVRSQYLDFIGRIFPDVSGGETLLPALLAGGVLFLLVSVLNIWIVRRKVNAIWTRR